MALHPTQVDEPFTWKLQLSRFEANNGSGAISNAASQPSRTQSGCEIGGIPCLVRSRFRRSQSSCSTHMYNCRRALEDSQYLGIAKRANIVHLTPMTGGPFILRPCRWSLLQLSYEWSLAHLVHGYGLQTVVLSQKWRLDGEKVTSKPSKRYLATHTAPGQSSRPAPYSDSSY